MRILKFFRLLSSFLLVVFLYPLAEATIIVKMDTPELVQNSCSIVIGEIVEIDKKWEAVQYPQGSYTLNVTLRLKVEKIIKVCPNIHEGDIVSIERLGGKSEGLDLSIPGSPTFNNKTRVLLFLTELPDEKHIITGFSQGKFRILKDTKTGEEKAVQDKSARALTLVDPTTGKLVGRMIPKYVNLQDLIREVNQHLDQEG